MASKVDHPTMTVEYFHATHVALNGAIRIRNKVLVTQHQLAASIVTALQIAGSEAIAAFLLDPATTLADCNPLFRTTSAAQRQICAGQQPEFASFGVSVLGVPCLLNALQRFPNDEPLVQEMLQAGLCRAHVFHKGDGCRFTQKIPLPFGTFFPVALCLIRSIALCARTKFFRKTAVLVLGYLCRSVGSVVKNAFQRRRISQITHTRGNQSCPLSGRPQSLNLSLEAISILGRREVFCQRRKGVTCRQHSW